MPVVKNPKQQVSCGITWGRCWERIFGQLFGEVKERGRVAEGWEEGPLRKGSEVRRSQKREVEGREDQNSQKNRGTGAELKSGN